MRKYDGKPNKQSPVNRPDDDEAIVTKTEPDKGVPSRTNKSYRGSKRKLIALIGPNRLPRVGGAVGKSAQADDKES